MWGKLTPLHMEFTDLTKAFDSDSRVGLYIPLKKFGCPQRLLNLVYENEESKAFAINNGVKQGCVLASVLFNIYISSVRRHAFQANDEGIYEKL